MTSPDPHARHPLLADPAWLRAEYATKSAQQIAREHGLPRDAVYAALRAAGIPRSVNRYGAPIAERVPADVVDQVVARYAAGASIERVADELGLTMGVVSRVLDAQGVRRLRRESTDCWRRL